MPLTKIQSLGITDGTIVNDDINSSAAITLAKLTGVNDAKAWVNFNGTGTPAIGASFNVTSITDNGTGSYTVNFTTAFADVNYVLCGSSQDNNSSGTSTFTSHSRTTSGIVILCSTSATDTLFDTAVMNVAIFR